MGVDNSSGPRKASRGGHGEVRRVLIAIRCPARGMHRYWRMQQRAGAAENNIHQPARRKFRQCVYSHCERHRRRPALHVVHRVGFAHSRTLAWKQHHALRNNFRHAHGSDRFQFLYHGDRLKGHFRHADVDNCYRRPVAPRGNNHHASGWRSKSSLSADYFAVLWRRSPVHVDNNFGQPACWTFFGFDRNHQRHADSCRHRNLYRSSRRF